MKLLCYTSTILPIILAFTMKYQFITDILSHKHINVAYIFTCWNAKASLQIQKTFNKNDIRSRFWFPSMGISTELGKFYGKFGYVVDVSCVNWSSILGQVTKSRIYRGREHWFFICDSIEVFEKFSTSFKAIDVKVDSNVFVVLLLEHSYSIYESYNPGYYYGGVLTINNIANYSNGNLNFTKVSMYERRKDLSSLHLHVGLIITKNFTPQISYLRDRRMNYYDSQAKVNFGAFEHIVEIHKFRWTEVVTPIWFGPSPHDTDAGIAEILYKNIAQLSATSGIMTPDRVEKLDYLMGLYSFRTCFIYRNLGTYGQIQSQVLTIFSTGCWVCFLVLGVTYAIILKIINRIERNSYVVTDYSWTSVIVYTIAAFSQQGAQLHHNYLSGRLVVFSLLVVTYLLYNYYTSSIVSSLINDIKPSFQTVAQLIYSNLNLGLEDITYMERLFAATEDKDLLYLYKEILANNSKVNYYTPQDGIALVKKGGFAYHVEPPTGYKFIYDTFEDSDICELSEVNIFDPVLLYVIGQKGGEYNKMILIRKMSQAGLIYRQTTLWKIQKPVCRSKAQFVNVGIEYASPALLVLIVGVVSAIIIFGCEIIYDWKNRQSQVG